MDAETVRERLADARARLEATRAELLSARGGSLLESTGELVSHDDHLADAASDTYDREAQASLLNGIDAELRAIEVAEGRLLAGTYATCDTCAGPIGADRLEAVPWATRCLADQLQAEQLDRSLRAEVLHGPSEAEATHNIVLVPDPELDLDLEEVVDLQPEEGAVHLEHRPP